MCGIVGLFSESASQESLLADLKRMARALNHRGPDAEGYFVDANSSLGLGHRRLSIIELSDRAAQPMVSECGRFVLSYNGEIYNFKEVKQELEAEGVAFSFSSDTLVFLKAVEHWGLKKSLSKFRGMFAFALWDKATKQLSLGRDRFGEKPLYFGRVRDTLYICSELKALYPLKDLDLNISQEAMLRYLQFGNIPAPECIFEGFQKVLPGHFLVFVSPNSKPQSFCYWSAIEVARNSKNHLIETKDEEAIALIEAELSQIVKMQMVSDVPLGAFLSGGIDSSTVVSLMQAHSQRKIRTFTIGYEEGRYDESKTAEKVAQILGTDHTSLVLDAKEVVNNFSDIAMICDEPFADASSVPTYLVSRLAKSAVTVSISGDGGDEIFGGYNRHLFAGRYWEKVQRFPSLLKSSAASGIGLVKQDRWDQIGSLSKRIRLLGEKLYKLKAVLKSKSDRELYHKLLSLNLEPEELLDRAGPNNPVTSLEKLCFSPAENFMLYDTEFYLCNDILTKVDRASMSVSLESRAPYLDHKLFELAWRLPMQMKIRGSQTKWILRQIAYRHLPESILNQPKMGFAFPIQYWLKGELREWSESLLNEDALKRSSVFDKLAVGSLWQSFLNDEGLSYGKLWSVLMFQAWYDQWRNLSA